MPKAPPPRRPRPWYRKDELRQYPDCHCRQNVQHALDHRRFGVQDFPNPPARQIQYTMGTAPDSLQNEAASKHPFAAQKQRKNSETQAKEQQQRSASRTSWGSRITDHFIKSDGDSKPNRLNVKRYTNRRSCVPRVAARLAGQSSTGNQNAEPANATYSGVLGDTRIQQELKR